VPFANYKYTSDAGNLYQVSIPSDFPNALSMPVASGTEPYLDAVISPRYSNWRSNSGVTRTSVIGTSSLLSGLPASIVVDGITFYPVSTIGEKIPPYLPALSMFPQGPMGPSGASGLGATLFVDIQNSDVAITGGSGSQTINTLNSLPAGKYLLLATFTFQNNSVTGTRIEVNIYSSLVGAISGAAAFTSTTQPWSCCSLIANYEPAASFNLITQAIAYDANVIAKSSAIGGISNSALQLIALKYA
jgi:hypothetical protein